MLILERTFAKRILHRHERTVLWQRLLAYVNIPVQLQWRRQLLLAWLLDSANVGELDRHLHAKNLSPILPEATAVRWMRKIEIATPSFLWICLARG
jgi:hypothetical protein